MVTTNHGPFDENLGPIYAEMSRRGVAVVAISAHQASTAPDVRISAVIHHGIDVADVPMGDGGGGYACFLGRMVPDKGVREAVLAARAAEMPLRIAAKMREPEEEQYFEEVVQPLLGGNIEYIGDLDHEDKYELLGNAVALLNPLQWPGGPPAATPGNEGPPDTHCLDGRAWAYSGALVSAMTQSR
jgi:glycosyltransferase involved in cell wall biosynthesis